jgi:hypothetical protein
MPALFVFKLSDSLTVSLNQVYYALGRLHSEAANAAVDALNTYLLAEPTGDHDFYKQNPATKGQYFENYVGHVMKKATGFQQLGKTIQIEVKVCEFDTTIRDIVNKLNGGTFLQGQAKGLLANAKLFWARSLGKAFIYLLKLRLLKKLERTFDDATIKRFVNVVFDRMHERRNEAEAFHLFLLQVINDELPQVIKAAMTGDATQAFALRLQSRRTHVRSDAAAVCWATLTEQCKASVEKYYPRGRFSAFSAYLSLLAAKREEHKYWLVGSAPLCIFAKHSRVASTVECNGDTDFAVDVPVNETPEQRMKRRTEEVKFWESNADLKQLLKLCGLKLVVPKISKNDADKAAEDGKGVTDKCLTFQVRRSCPPGQDLFF